MAAKLLARFFLGPPGTKEQKKFCDGLALENQSVGLNSLNHIIQKRAFQGGSALFPSRLRSTAWRIIAIKPNKYIGLPIDNTPKWCIMFYMDITTAYADYSLDELKSYYSDFHRDYYGFRPLLSSDREDLIWEIEFIHRVMNTLKETFAGREELRSKGWVVEEVEPELIQQAKWLAQERDRQLEEELV